MSRSHKHSPFTGITTSETERDDKKIWHGALRAAEREFLAKVDINTSDDDNLVEPVVNDVSSPWDFAKDGKQRLNLNNEDNLKLMRK